MEFAISDLKERYGGQEVSPAFSRLYDGEPEFGRMFAILHERLNRHFDDINDRARSTRHFWADNSRDLIGLIGELREDLHLLGRAGAGVELATSYQEAIGRYEPWLSSSGGSEVPEDFERIEVLKYEPVFVRSSASVRLKKAQSCVERKMVGSGSYADVYSYVDPDYGVKFAVKRAKRGLGDRDLRRFRKEFEVMKGLSFPYVVQVYTYDEDLNEYRMEYCDETLRKYIARKNATLPFGSRRRIALQFLYGLNYLHRRGILHRDISLQNVMLKVFHDGAVLVKLADFGLVKDRDSTFTRTQTEMRGTIRDPQLVRFKDYGVPSEIYATGHVLAYIFTGRDALNVDGADVAVGAIVRKCTSADVPARYASVLEVIADVERLQAAPAEASA